MKEQLEVDRVFETYLPNEANTDDVENAYKDAVKDLHPDTGGHAKAFNRATKAKNTLLEEMHDGETYQITSAKAKATENRTTDYESNTAGYTVASEEVQDFLNMMDKAEEVVEKKAQELDKEINNMMSDIGADEELRKMEELAGER